MVRTFKQACMSVLFGWGLVFVGILPGVPVSAQSYETSFSAVQYDRSKGPSTFHGGVEVDDATGSLDINIPLGRGIGVRGIHFQPALRGNWGPVADNPLISKLRHIGTQNNGSPKYEYQLSTSQIARRPNLDVSPGYMEIFLDVTAITQSSHFIGPDGKDVTLRSRYYTGIPSEAEKLDLLAFPETFGLGRDGGPWRLSEGSLMRTFGGNGELVVGLANSSMPEKYLKTITDGTDNPIIDTSGQPLDQVSHIVPQVILVVKGDIAYEYRYHKVVYSQIGKQVDQPDRMEFGIGMTGGDTNTWEPVFSNQYQLEDGSIRLYTIQKAMYKLSCIRNRFNDRIEFSDSLSNVQQVEARLWYGDNNSGLSVVVSRSCVKYFGDDNNQSYKINLQELPSFLKDEGSYCSISSQGLAQYHQTSSRWSEPVLPVSVIDENSNESVLFETSILWNGQTYGTLHGISAVTYPGRRIAFDWGQYGYRQNLNSPNGRWKGYIGRADSPAANQTFTPGLAWGVTKITETDIASTNVRTTRHYRYVPIPDNNNATKWIDTKFQTVVIHPDGSGRAVRFMSPLNTGATGGPECSLDAQMQTLGHLKHLATEIWEYGANSITDPMAAFMDREKAYRISYFDRWDLRAINNPSGAIEHGAVPVQTRTRVWDKLTGEHRIIERLGWDASACAWKTTRTSLMPIAQAPSPVIEYTPELPVETVPVPSVNALKIWDENISYYPGDRSQWFFGRIKTLDTVHRKDQLAGAVDDLTLKPVAQKIINRDTTVPKLNRIESFQEGSLTRTFTFAGIQGSGAAQPKSVSVTGAGLIGNAGIVDYIYDSWGYLSGISPKVSFDNPSEIRWTDRQTNYASGKPKEQIDANGIIRRFLWDDSGRLTDIIPLFPEHATHYAYDADSLGVVITRGDEWRHLRFNGFGEMILEVRRGKIDGGFTYSHRRYGYDLGGRKQWETVWLPGDGTETGWGNSLTVGDIPASSRTFCTEWMPVLPGSPPYCLAWETEYIEASFGNSATHYVYDTFGRPIQISTPAGSGRLVPDRTDISYLSHGTAQVIKKVIDLRATFTFKDIAGRVFKIVNPKNQVAEYQYNAENKICRVKQYVGSSGSGVSAVGVGSPQTREWSYNNLGWLETHTQPESGITAFSRFDVNGKPWTVSYNGRVLNYVFDALGRLKSIKSLLPDVSVDQGFTYDEGGFAALANGKLTTATAGTGVDLVKRVLAYNGQGGLNGRLTTLTRTLDGITPFVQSFTYDSHGRMNTRGYPDGKVQAIGYVDGTDLPKSTDFISDRLANMNYDPISWNLKTLAYGGSFGASSTFAFGPDQVRLATLTHEYPGKTLKKWTYAYDGAGRLSTDGEDYFSYDELGRLTGAFVRDPFDGANGNANSGLMQAFGYDAFGNRISARTQTLTAWTANAKPAGSMSPSDTLRPGLNEVTANVTFSASDPAFLKNRMPETTTTGAHYDAQGNLERVYTTPGNTDTQVNMTYDALGRVTSLSHGPNASRVTEQYLHDDEGLRIRIWDGTKYRYNIYNEARQLIAQYEKTPTGSLTWKKDIIYVGTKEIAEYTKPLVGGVPTDKYSVTMCDHLGSPRFIWDGTTLTKQKFLPFGEQLPGPLGAPIPAKGFTNHEATDASGLIYMQARMYLPAYGRFASPDPGGDQDPTDPQSWHLYAYCRNNPVMNTDPTGMYSFQSGVTDDQKKQFTTALADARANLSKISDAGDRALMQRSLDAYGSLGDNNGVTVAFQASIPDASAKTNWTNTQQPFSIDPSDQMKVRSDVTVTFSGKSDLAIDVPHEGSHTADFQQLGKSVNTTGDPVGDPNNVTSRQTETKAYTVSAIAGQADGRSKVQFSGGVVYDKSWQPAALGQRNRAEGVRKQVETYKDKDKKIYTEAK